MKIYGALERRLTIYILIVLILFATLASLLIIRGKHDAIIDENEEFLKYISNDITYHYNLFFDKIYSNSVALNESFAKRIIADEVPPPSMFKEKILQRSSDGTIRIKENNSGFYMPSNIRVDERTKKLYFFSKRVFQLFDPIIRRTLYNYYFITKDGIIRISPPDWIFSIEDKHDFNNDIFYAIGKPENNPAKIPRWTNVYFDSIWHKWMISLIIPIYDKDEFLGITGEDIILDDIFGELTKFTEVNRKFSAFILDKKGDILIDPDSFDTRSIEAVKNSQVVQQDSLEEHERILASKVMKEVHSFDVKHFDYDGDSFYYRAAKINQLDWTICIYTKQSLIMDRFDVITKEIVLLAIFISIIIFFIIRVFFKYLILKRIKRLGDSVQQIISGDLEFDIDKIRKDELGFLERGISHLQTSLLRKNKEIDRTHEELQVSESKYKGYIENAPYGIFVLDEKSYFIEVNKSFERITGFSKSDLLSTKLSFIVHKDSLSKAGEFFSDLRSEGSASDEFAFQTSDEDKRYWAIEAVQLTNKVVLGFVNDTTDLRESELILKELKERFELSLKINNSSVFVSNLITREVIFTPQLFIALGYNSEEIPTTIDQLNNLIHPEDLESIMKSLNDYFIGKKNYCYAEFRLKTKAAKWLWIDAQGKITKYDKSGNPEELVGISRVIEAKKRAEIALIKYRDELELMVTERTNELEQKNEDLKKFNDLFIGREFRIKELKQENNILKQKILELEEENPYI